MVLGGEVGLAMVFLGGNGLSFDLQLMMLLGVGVAGTQLWCFLGGLNAALVLVRGS